MTRDKTAMIFIFYNKSQEWANREKRNIYVYMGDYSDYSDE